MDKSFKPTDDYTQGQMMGMLCIIRMLRLAENTNKIVAPSTLDNMENLATGSLAGYLQIREEDVILLVDTQLEKL